MQMKTELKLDYIDQPEVKETFADSIRSIHFDGQTMRMELCVTRFEKSDNSKSPIAKQHPVCRLVLTPNATLDLANKVQQMMAALEKSGAVKKTTSQTPTHTIQ